MSFALKWSSISASFRYYSSRVSIFGATICSSKLLSPNASIESCSISWPFSSINFPSASFYFYSSWSSMLSKTWLANEAAILFISMLPRAFLGEFSLLLLPPIPGKLILLLFYFETVLLLFIFPKRLPSPIFPSLISYCSSIFLSFNPSYNLANFWSDASRSPLNASIYY